MLFRGYVITKNKECKMPFKGVKDNDLLSLEEAQKLDEYAGILASEVVLIDIDEYEQSEVLMDIVEDLQLRCRVYQTTRGKHFLFKNVINANGEYLFNKAVIKAKLACGLMADIKLGCKNGYSILKFKGKERTIIYDKLDDEEYQEAPKFLLPVKSKVNFNELGEGDGRNNEIFNYILTLQSAGFSKKEAKECLKLINKYVMKASLSERELNVIMRDGAFKKELFFAEKTFLFDKFSKYLMNNACIRRINGSLHIYRDGVYVDGYEYIEREMIKNIPNLKAAHRTEVLKYLNLIVPEVNVCSAYKIAFANGIYDITTGQLSDFDSEIIITNKIPFDYSEGAYAEIADNTLNKLACNDSEIRALLEEAIGYSFFRRNELRKAFVLIGDKKNGKSTFLQMLGYVVGDSNVSALDLDDIGDRFRTAEMDGKLINEADDIEDEYRGKTGMLKKVISGSEILIERKGQDPYKVKLYCKQFLSANNMPRFKDRGGALLDRLVPIPFNNSFSPEDEDYDPFIISKLMKPECAEYLISIGIEGLKRVLKNNCFTEPESVIAEKRIIDEKNNPILLFYKVLEEDEVINKTSQEVYLRYSEWCICNGFQAMSNIEFSRQLSKRYNLTTKVKKIEGKAYNIFVKKG